MADQAPDVPGTTPTGAAPDAELRRLVGLGPRLKQFLQDAEVTGTEGPAALQFERYRVLCLIGEGGMGSVYEAEQIQPRRRVALKVAVPFVRVALVGSVD